MRFIHTADWQIGKSFRRYGDNESVLRRARLDSIERIGALALSENAPLVLVAGDVFDHFAPSDQTAGEPLERMRAFADVRWLLLPGNHDPHRPDAVWDRLLRRGLPANVTPLLAPQPFALSPEAVVLPAPLLRNSETSDLTRWMEDAPSPPGALRIGLAHGAVVGFSEQQEAANRIDPGRARTAGLAYLALGDWHRTMQINERVWYSGTHEPDRAGGQKTGQALLVVLEGADAPPRVSARDVGAYRWETLALDLAGRSAQDVETSLRALPDPQRMLVRIGFSGAAPLALRAQTEKLIDDLRAAFFHIEADFDSVRPYPSEDDLDALDFDGVLRKSAEILRAEAADETRPAQERRIATDALVALYGLEMSRRGRRGRAMKLTHISVEGVGRFAQGVTVRDIAPGLNVLAAPNEAGKSTLFKAMRACVFEKHTARHNDIHALAGGPAGAPVTIELGFEEGGAHYVVRKSFLHAPRALLIKDGREIAAGRTADEMLHEILGLRPASGRSMDEGALGLLWVGQTQSFEPPHVEGQARDSISSAIEREVGDLAGGERARAMLKQAEAQLADFLTDKGAVAKNGPLGRAETVLQTAETRLAEETALLSELERDIAALESLRQQRAAHDAPGVEADLRARMAESAAALTQARAALEQTRGLEKDEELARRSLEQAQAAFADAQARAQRIDQTRATLAQAQENLAPLETQAQDCAQALAKLRAAREALDEADARCAQQDAHLRKLAGAAEAAAKTPALVARLAQLEALATEIETTTQARASLQISDRIVHDLEACERDAALLRDRLAAAAPQVEITPAPDARDRFRIGAEAIAAPRVFALTQPLRVEAPGVGAISLSPPPQFGEAEQTRLRELVETRVFLLETLGVQNLAQARERLERAGALDRALATSHARLAAFECAPADLAKTLAALRGQIAAAQASVRETLGGEPAPDAGAIAAKRDALEAQRAQDRQERLRLQASETAQQELRAELAESRAALRARLGEAQSALAADLAALPDQTRAQILANAGAALGAARAAQETARLALEAARASAPDAQRLADLEARAQRYGDALAEHQRHARALADDMSRIEGALSVRGGGGLGERVQARREERDLALADVERLRGQVAALRRLRDVISACYQEQREKLQTPLRRCLQPFLDDLFPQAQVTLNESFGVESLTRAGAGEAFAQLSGGTREQIAVLVRLAMGALLRERGEEAPIILDDALVFCDDERIERMFDALNRAAQRQQVIVLTCRTRSSRTLGGRSLRIEPLEAPLR